MEIMTPDNSRWQEFYDKLRGPEGVDIQGDGFPADCDCDFYKPKARKILESMGNIDVDGTINYFNGCDARCDCEVLFNVDLIEAEIDSLGREHEISPIDN